MPQRMASRLSDRTMVTMGLEVQLSTTTQTLSKTMRGDRNITLILPSICTSKNILVFTQVL